MFRILGFASVTYVSLEDQAALYFIEKYVKFKQGEVWRQIKAEFEAEVSRGKQRITIGKGLGGCRGAWMAVGRASSASGGGAIGSAGGGDEELLWAEALGAWGGEHK